MRGGGQSIPSLKAKASSVSALSVRVTIAHLLKAGDGPRDTQVRLTEAIAEVS